MDSEPTQPKPVSRSSSEGRGHKGVKRGDKACERCHKNKTKCDGQTPCRGCRQARKSTKCVYPVRDKKVTVLESYIKQLEAENNMLKRRRSSEQSSASHGQSPSHAFSIQAQANSAFTLSSTSGVENKDHYHIPAADQGSETYHSQAEAEDSSTDVGMKVIADETILPRYCGEASPETFGSRLHQYVNHGEMRPPPRPYTYYKNPKLLRNFNTPCKLPNKNYAKLLVRAVLRFIGGDHHLLLRKTFMQRLEETYQRNIPDDPVWMCRFFVVLALGELYSTGRVSTAAEAKGVPGTGFFMRAMGFFQDMHEEPTIPYIETLLLLSFYCVALNRRNTAYTYAGLALRLGLTLGLHRKIPADSGMSASEREHRVRVWWTAYALDRIYTSKVGLPIMLRDSDIDVQMPSMDGLTPEEAEDFYPPELMTAQIKLARITGNIMSDLYRIPQPGRANTFVQSVQRILTSLRQWHETLPEVLRLNFNAMPIYPSRSVASLHLHFGNAMIQTTRPILFHLFRSNFSSSSTDTNTSPKEVSPMTYALADACVQAAKTSNSILAQLYVDGCLAPFGYFDAISVFASTQILMMSSIMKEGKERDENDAVETAWSVLCSMRDAGNLPAAGYYDQLLELKTDLNKLRAANSQRTQQAQLQSPLSTQYPNQVFNTTTTGAYATSSNLQNGSFPQPSTTTLPPISEDIINNSNNSNNNIILSPTQLPTTNNAHHNHSHNHQHRSSFGAQDSIRIYPFDIPDVNNPLQNASLEEFLRQTWGAEVMGAGYGSVDGGSASGGGLESATASAGGSTGGNAVPEFQFDWRNANIEFEQMEHG